VEREFNRSDWENYRARQLTDAIRTATDDFRERYWGEAQTWQRQAFELGLKPFAEMGISLNWAGIWRQGFEAYAQNGLYFITDLSDDLRRALSREVLLTTTGLQAPTQAMQNVKDLLGDGRKAAARSQAIVRTEVGRNFNTANFMALSDAAQFVPGLMKMWLHGVPRKPRIPHVLAHGESIPVQDYFYFPGGALRYPHDPQGPASETVNCTCRVVGWHPDWGI
jgi:hypothetical protein